MRVILRILCWCLLASSLFLIAGCGVDSTSSGTLQVALTDAVDPDFKEVVISIKEVRAVLVGDEETPDETLSSIKTFEPPLSVNVLDLAYQQVLLGEADVPAGNYRQIRLVLEANVAGEPPANYVTLQDESVVAVDSDQLALKTPCAQTSGLKINGEFSVLPGEMTTIVLDFDPARAIHKTGRGKWIFKPTGIRLVEIETVLPQYGAITGVVLSNGAVVEGAMVSIIPDGGLEPIASEMVNAEDGSFRAQVPEGTYLVEVEANRFEDYSSLPLLFEVVVGEDTAAGVIEMSVKPY